MKFCKKSNTANESPPKTGLEGSWREMRVYPWGFTEVVFHTVGVLSSCPQTWGSVHASALTALCTWRRSGDIVEVTLTKAGEELENVLQ